MGSDRHSTGSGRDDTIARAPERRRDRDDRRRSRSPASPRKRPRHEADDGRGGHRENREKREHRDHRDHRDREQRSHSEHREHRHRREHRDRDGDRRHRSPDDDEAYERRRRRRHHDEDPDADGEEEERNGSRKHERRDRHDKPAVVRQRGPLPDQAASFALTQGGGGGGGGGEDGGGGVEKVVEKEKPNLQATGVLAAESNRVALADGTVTTLKYHEPPEARKPPARDVWRLFVFKKEGTGSGEAEEAAPPIPLSARSCWLVGRDAAVADVVAAHPSVSGQHAVVQFRYRERRNEYGERYGRVRPYLLDLASANGTRLNHEPVAPQRYVELRSGDVVTFGLSTREYVVVLAPREDKEGQ